MTAHRGAQSAHRRHARGLFDNPTKNSKSDSSGDIFSLLFGSGDSSSTTTSSTTTQTIPTILPIITTDANPFSTTSDRFNPFQTTGSSTTSSSTSTTSSTSTSSTSTSLPSLSSSSTSTITITMSSSGTHGAENAASTSAAPSGATSTGKIVGGIGAGVLGIAALFAIAAFFLRRMRRRREEVAFDASSFRRSAMLMPDPPTHQDTIAAGFNPRPPPVMTMAENRPATFGTMYGPYRSQHGYSPNPSANPFISPSPYAQSPNASDPFSPPVLTRNFQSSGHGSLPSADYLELNRSTANTPDFEIVHAQYVDVSKKTGVPPPVPQKDIPFSVDSHDLTPPLASPSKHGVPLSPPILPEIALRDSGYAFPTPLTGTFPVSPSPMASSFVLSPNPYEKGFKDSLIVPPPAHTASAKRPETIYDLNDAYGGI